MQSPTIVLSDVLIEGAHVRVRPLTAEDAEQAFPLVHGVRAVLDWLCWQGPTDLDDLRCEYGRWRIVTPNGTNYRFAVERRADGALLGTATLRYVDHPHVGDLGYWLGVPFHGQGYGTELVGLLVHLGFEVLHSTALTAEVFPGNAASEAILARSGFLLAREVPHGPVEASGACAAGGAPDPLRRRNLYLCMPGDRPQGVPAPVRVRCAT